MTQVHDILNTMEHLCKKWVVDSIEINDMGKKFPAPFNIKNNYSDYKKDGTFQGRDGDVVINGKWKLNSEKMQIINYDIDNPLLKGEIVFTIVKLTESNLVITSKPLSANQVTMHYKLYKTQ